MKHASKSSLDGDEKQTALQDLAKAARVYQNSKVNPKPIEQAYYLQNYNPLKKKKEVEDEITTLVQGSSVHTSNQDLSKNDSKARDKRDRSKEKSLDKKNEGEEEQHIGHALNNMIWSFCIGTQKEK